MKWKTGDIQTYKKAKEYVDTAVVPLIPVQFGKQEIETAEIGEFTAYITESIEKQFTGRVFLMPPFTYITEEPPEERSSRLKKWDSHFFKNGFEHVVYVTSDISWKQAVNTLPDELIWLPASALESDSGGSLKKLIDQQVQHILPIFTAKWEAGPVKRDE